MLEGVSVTGPNEVGVIVNVCASDELLNVLTIDPVRPPPERLIVMFPLTIALGVIVKFDDAVLIGPPAGPARV